MDHNIMRRLSVGVSSAVLAAGLVLAAEGTAFADASAGGICAHLPVNQGPSCSGGDGRGGLNLNLFHIIHLNIHLGGGRGGGNGNPGGGHGGPG